MLAGALVAILIGIGYYFIGQSSERIVDFNQARDSAFILDLFKKDWYWLVGEGSDFDPEYMLKYSASSKKPEDIGNQTIKVMFVDNKPVGFIAYHKKKFYEGVIHFIDINEDFRSKGYGQKLLKYAIADLKKHGVTKITLVTRTNNYPAQAIYKKAGFKEVWQTNGFVYFEHRVD
jgi:ribosomal protein S18 acetylase RimI-like enzyme